MQRHTRNASPELGDIAHDARALLTATGHLAGRKVEAARERLATALDRTKDAWVNVQSQAKNGAKATDRVIRGHPYHAVGIALGVGTVVGFLLARRD
jgi:ElaB/YqjD/DUF883 family membrane-anchored ribosome-binding protein